jgi:hypothetical protein
MVACCHPYGSTSITQGVSLASALTGTETLDELFGRGNLMAAMAALFATNPNVAASSCNESHRIKSSVDE